MNTLIIQFAKFPIKGYVKTRLQPTLGEAGCYKLHQNLVRHTAAQILESPFASVIAFDQMDSHDLLTDLAVDMPVLLQQGEDLGVRMRNAFEWALRKYEKVILVGSDCPALTSDHYQQVDRELEDQDFVFVPAEDGGYVLIACRKVLPRLFENISWGTGNVWQETQVALEGEMFQSLDPLWDVDREEDFIRLAKTFPALCVL